MPVKRALLALLCLMAGCSEVIQTEYPSLTSPAAQDAMRKGWIPDFVPATALKVSEKHDIDTGRTVLAFRLPPEERASALKDRGQKVEGETVRQALGALSFWPRHHRSALQKAAAQEEGFFLITDARGNGWMAIVSQETDAVFAFTVDISSAPRSNDTR